MAEQTQQYAGKLAQVVLTDPRQAADKNPRVLAKLKDLEQGLRILGRLAIGDQTALAEAGIKTAGVYNTQAHEWAIGRDRRDRTTCYLIAGGPTAVDWSHATLAGLVSIAHSHPFLPAERTAFKPNAAPLVLQALTTPPAAVKTGPQRVNVTLMQDDLSYLFPSNQDLYAAYRGEFERPEVVYTPYRLAPDGRLSLTQGGNISVKYGPVLAALSRTVEDSLVAKQSRLISRDPVYVESKSLGYFRCALEFFADHKSILTGVMQAPPSNSKIANLGVGEFAMFYPGTTPATGRKRSEMLAYLSSLLA